MKRLGDKRISGALWEQAFVRRFCLQAQALSEQALSEKEALSEKGRAAVWSFLDTVDPTAR